MRMGRLFLTNGCSFIFLIVGIFFISCQAKFVSVQKFEELNYPNAFSFVFFHNGTLYATAGVIDEYQSTDVYNYMYKYSSDFKTIETTLKFPQKCKKTPCQSGVLAMDIRGDIGYFQLVMNLLGSGTSGVTIYIYTIDLPTMTILNENTLPSLTAVPNSWLPYSENLDLLMSDNPNEKLLNLTLSPNGTVAGTPEKINYFFYYGFGMEMVNNTDELFVCGVELPDRFRYQFLTIDSTNYHVLQSVPLVDHYCGYGIIDPSTKLFATYSVREYEYIELSILDMTKPLPKQLTYQQVATINNGVGSQFNYDGKYAFLGPTTQTSSMYYQVDTTQNPYKIIDSRSYTDILLGANANFRSPFSLTMSQVREFSINYNYNGTNNLIAVIYNTATYYSSEKNGFYLFQYDDEVAS